MATALIVLCPPRSFSSVVATMIGQHPELYGFPELHLFSEDTMDTSLTRLEKRGKAVTAGLGRFIAQEVFGGQTARTALQAIEWIRERRSWTTRQMFEHALELVAPKIGVEKSPGTAGRFSYMERAAREFPDAYFLHLTRHPVSARNSMEEFFEVKANRARHQAGDDEGMRHLRESFDRFLLWYHMHASILRFTNGLAPGKTMRIKGEDVLSEPGRFLPQIAEWMGLRTDAEAIECMKHPEESLYAYAGPRVIFGGNDPKFTSNPRLRGGRVREPSLEAFLKERPWHYIHDAGLQETFAGHPLIIENNVTSETLLEDIRVVTHLLGYK